MVALAILSIGIWGVADLLMASEHAGARAQAKMAANALGQLKFEELSAAGPNLQAYLAAAKPDSSGEVLYPPDGPRPFQQNNRFTYRAHLKKAEAGQGVLAAVEVRRAGAVVDAPPVARVAGIIAAAGSEVK